MFNEAVALTELVSWTYAKSLLSEKLMVTWPHSKNVQKTESILTQKTHFLE